MNYNERCKSCGYKSTNNEFCDTCYFAYEKNLIKQNNKDFQINYENSTAKNMNEKGQLFKKEYVYNDEEGDHKCIKEYYQKQKIFDSDIERKIFDKMKECLPDYIIIPQINLQAIINIRLIEDCIENKKSIRNDELYRNIDFGIFDNNYKIILLVEINGKEHNTSDYKLLRDYSIHKILQQCNIPLLTFQIQEEDKDIEIIIKEIQEELKKLGF